MQLIKQVHAADVGIQNMQQTMSMQVADVTLQSSQNDDARHARSCFKRSKCTNGSAGPAAA